MTLRITGLSTKPDSEAKISFQARLDALGTISADTAIKPFVMPLAFEMTCKLNNYALEVLTPYVGKYTGHKVKDGARFSLSMNYRVADNQLNASHKILVQSFDLGDKVESKDALNLPFNLALAILEDSQNRIDINLPVTGDMSKPDFHYTQLIWQVLKKFFLKVITEPFSFLGSIVGAESGSEELGYVRFLPGNTDLTAAEKEKLNIVIKALKERPKLSLEVKGSYDSVVDWRAIKADVFNKDFWILRKDSKRLDSWVYQELYQRRFGIMSLWKLTKSYRLKSGIYDDDKINEEIKRQLIADGSANKVALGALAEGRAKVIYDFIVAAGFDVRRISIGEVKECQANAGFIPLELVLTVFDNSSAGSSNFLSPAEIK
jgi:outer membrane protein OmpA-like peptidoglycan-associated protein